MGNGQLLLMESSVKPQDKTIFVFGAKGQHGGSLENALRSRGWQVKALVRGPNSKKSEAIAAQGIELVRGDLTDVQSIQAAMVGVYGVFSVQPSSGQGAASSVTDEDEI